MKRLNSAEQAYLVTIPELDPAVIKDPKGTHYYTIFSDTSKHIFTKSMYKDSTFLRKLRCSWTNAGFCTARSFSIQWKIQNAPKGYCSLAQTVSANLQYVSSRFSLVSCADSQ